jgi:5-methylcytosine-specific restriction protein B
LNDGCLYSFVFYSEGIKELWQVRIWAFAPGENGYKWEELRQQGLMAIGWDEIGDLRNYKSKKSIADFLKENDETDGSHKNDSLALWQFCNEMKVGDKIYAKAGSKTLLGVGEVISDYQYDESREAYKHVRKVNWTNSCW